MRKRKMDEENEEEEHNKEEEEKEREMYKEIALEIKKSLVVIE